MSLMKKCIGCDVQFRVYPSGIKKYCSKMCMSLSKKKSKVKKCEECDVEFEGRDGTSKYCSQTCSNSHRARNLIQTCLACSVEFKRRENTQLYCSRKCGGIHRSNKVKCICQVCNTKFEVKKSRIGKFCSIKCICISNSNMWKSEQNGKRILESLLIDYSDIPTTEFTERQLENIFNLSQIDLNCDTIDGVGYINIKGNKC